MTVVALFKTPLVVQIFVLTGTIRLLNLNTLRVT
jgi:hypothetical protein